MRVLPVQPRRRVRRAPAPPARARRRGDPQPRGLDPLQLRDPRRARDRRLPASRSTSPTSTSREDWRRISVLRGPGRSGSCPGRAPDGYREALELLKAELRAVSGERDRTGSATLVAERRPRPAAGRRPGAPRRLGRDAVANVRWLTGFSGHQRAGASSAPTARLFFTDFRYTERAEREVVDDFERVIAERDADARPRSSSCAAGSATTTRRRASRTFAQARGDGSATGVELVPAAGLVEDLRRRKDAGELEAIAEAARPHRPGLRVGLPSAAWRGGPSARSCSPPTSACASSAPRTRRSRPSSRRARTAPCRTTTPRDARGAADELLLIDMGAIVDGYCSDCTRTFATGDLDAEAREVYALVRAAQAGAPRRDPAGAPGDRGRRGGPRRDHRRRPGDDFGHGLGHGVGLEVHEAPRLAKRSDDTLEAGDVVTVEPGVYLRAVRDPDRGPGHGHRGRLPQPERRRQGPASRRLAILVAELAIRVPSVEALFDAGAPSRSSQSLNVEARERILEAWTRGRKHRQQIRTVALSLLGLGATRGPRGDDRGRRPSPTWRR